MCSSGGKEDNDETQSLGRLCGKPVLTGPTVGEGGSGMRSGSEGHSTACAVAGNRSSSSSRPVKSSLKAERCREGVESGVIGCMGISGEMGVGGRIKFIIGARQNDYGEVAMASVYE